MTKHNQIADAATRSNPSLTPFNAEYASGGEHVLYIDRNVRTTVLFEEAQRRLTMARDLAEAVAAMGTEGQASTVDVHSTAVVFHHLTSEANGILCHLYTHLLATDRAADSQSRIAARDFYEINVNVKPPRRKKRASGKRGTP